MSASASENGEMSVKTETVKTGCSEANSPPSLQLSECTGNHNIIPTMTEITLAISDGADVAATCPEHAIVGQTNHTSSTDTLTHSENVGQKAHGNENHVNRRRGPHHSKQQQQQRPPKRRNTMIPGFKHPTSGKRRRRANSESDSVLPTNFLLGGNICDPLNLNSLLDEEVNRALNAETPKSSPLPAKSRDPVEIIIPRDITDPLNLNRRMADSSFLMSPFKRKRNRNRHHGGGGGGISAAHLDLSESAKSSEVKSSASTLPPDAPRGTSTLSIIPADSHDDKKSSSSNCEEHLTTSASAPQAQCAENSASAASGCQSQHSSKRKRKRHAAKAEPPFVPSTLIKKPVSAERCHSQAFHTPKSGPSPGGQQQQSHEQHKRQQQQKFEYGNYSKYYGYRNPGTSEDPRVHMLRPEWFKGKEVLDLGCNSGHLTLYIAKMLRPARILGLDIDSGLIHAARKNIRHYLSDQQTLEARRAMQEEKRSTKQESNDNERLQGRKTQTVKQEQDRDNGRESGAENGKADGAAQGGSGPAEAVKDNVSSCHTDDGEPRGQGCKAGETEKEDCEAPPSGHPFPVSLQISRGPIAAPLVTETSTAPPGEFPHNVSFIKANYVLENDRLLLTQRPEYDVILCLSVTKWVHLNWGDSGLKRLFQRVYRHLNPGGLFILEPQPWESYTKRKKLSENIFRNYHSIRLRPVNFSTYLTSEVGFSSYELIGTPRCSARGFQRPIYLFHK